MAEVETIEVRLPEGPQCAADGGQGVSCILPLANLAEWHSVYGGHLGRVTGGYVSWQEGNEPPEKEPGAPAITLYARPDVVDPEV
jgi:hypothetical protein